MKINYLVLLLGGGLSLLSCEEETPQDFIIEEYEILSEHLNLPEENFDYSINLPNHLAQLFSPNDPNSSVKANDALATLGRVMFYDTRLSLNETVSCATCHDQKKGFGDNVAFSKGFDGESAHRNSIALAATVGFEASYGMVSAGSPTNFGPFIKFSWDDMVPNLQEQSKHAIESPVEMGMRIHKVVRKLKEEEFYGVLFKRAFGNLEITDEKVLEALETFMNSIASVDTKFDRALDEAGLPDPFQEIPSFSVQENLGRELFNTNCISCHSFNHALPGIPVANNGLDLEYEDNGKGERTGKSYDMGMFKVPFLRNVALTAPYMHDGRFATLEEVIDHYSEGIQRHRNLSLELVEFSIENPGGIAKKFNFTSEEKDALVAYLHTLTDLSLASEEKFSDPFKR